MKIKCSIGLILMFVLAFSSCAPSKEKKAEMLANTIMQQILYYPDSYESISTRVDSAFVSIYTDNEAYLAVCELQKLQDGHERDMIESNLNRAKRSLAIWSGSWSAFAQEERRQAQQEIAKYEKELKVLDEKIEKQRNIIKQRADSIQAGVFCGWNIVHNYRCANGLGMASVSQVLLVADPTMEYPIFFCSLDDSDENSLQTIKEIIDSVLE